MHTNDRKTVKACKSGKRLLWFSRSFGQAKVASLDGEHPRHAELALICLDVVSTCGVLSASVAQVRTPCLLKRWISTQQCTRKAQGHGDRKPSHVHMKGGHFDDWKVELCSIPTWKVEPCCTIMHTCLYLSC